MEQLATGQKDIHQAAHILREGGLIAFPTETYYGLGVDPFNEKALQRLFVVKNRPAVKPILVLVHTRDDLNRLASNIPSAAEKLMDRFWPGPLTLVLSARKGLSELLTGGTGTIGVRISPHPVAEELLRVFAAPLTATSANKSGELAAVSETDVRGFFGDDLDMILSGGQTAGGKPSTLVGFSDNQSAECIREGCIPWQDITAALHS